MGKLFYFLLIWSPLGWWTVFRKQRPLCDKSNRHNKRILLWFTCTSPERFDQYRLGLTHWELIKKSIFEEEFFVDICPFLEYDMWESLSFVKPKRK